MRFTAAFPNGRDFYAFRFAENDEANSLYFREDDNRLYLCQAESGGAEENTF